ncbi:MAG: 50S ribosomal protein L6 [Candidatus Omnitrophica bacterium]|nr:50S ribosomal protein L6 [Candidatus Omnitrophota bacterium]
MSRLGAMPVAIPTGVKLTQSGRSVQVEGPKGKLAFELPEAITAAVKDNAVTVTRSGDEKAIKALHGLCRSLIANMVTGVSAGFQKELEIVGVGYRAQVQGKALTMTVGYSHPVALPIPAGLTVEAPKPTQVIVKGADKQAVGEFAATIRRVKPPEPYKGTGIRYAGEVVRRKAGKAATGSGAKAA